MARVKNIQICIAILMASLLRSQEVKLTLQTYAISDTMAYSYKKPKLFDMVRYIPKDIADFGRFTVQRDNLKWTGLTLGATALLIPFDQQLTDAATDFGSGFGWDKGHSYSKIGPLKIIPNDIHSAVYYIGNGGTTMLLSGAFLAMGSIRTDYRALNTSSELVEVLLSMGLITQAIKHITGRQSPFKAAETGNSGGQWRPFPGFKEYQTNTSNYDAMPSGHLATFMATLTVIATNYPELKWIKPVGYTLMGIMAFEMMSSQVHWISDYPLAILIGYAVGKAAANRRIIKNKISDTEANLRPNNVKTDFNFGQIGAYKTMGITITF
ncbi:MAG: phosphatase PAP2 family protein [Maribacter sp.]|nr:phosphatase PAP2 family protein [Maribacter sp.]